VTEIGLHPFFKGIEYLGEDSFSFAHNRDIRQACSEKKGVLKGHFRAADNHLHPGENLPDLSQKVEGALDVPQIESAADDLRLPVENPFEKMPVIEFLFLRGQPSRLVLGRETGALQRVEQIAGGHGQVFSRCRVVLKARQLEEEKLLKGIPVLHRALFYHRSAIRTNAPSDLKELRADSPKEL